MAKQVKPPPSLVKTTSGWYKLVVFKILSKYEDGTPKDCVLIKDDQSIELVGGEEFMTGYVPREMVVGDKQ